MSEVVLRAQSLVKHYTEGPARVEVLRGLDLAIGRGEMVAVIGASGAGKSTLLNMLGGLDRPTSGSVEVLGETLSALDEAARGRLRNRAIGFVYQFHHLLPEFSALENVAMPLLIGGAAPREAAARAAAMLARVGLAERSEHKPAELSGGERQRVAIARALVGKPATEDAVREAAVGADVVVMAAAVADYRVAEVSAHKLSKEQADGPEVSLHLVQTEDILAGLASGRAPGQTIVGFAAETPAPDETLLERGRRKAVRKGADLLAVNRVGWAEGFEVDVNALLLLDRRGELVAEARGDKRAVADALWDGIRKIRAER